MLKVVLLLVVVGLAKGQFDFYQLAEDIGKNFDYLELKKELDLNASFVVNWGVGEFYIMQKTVPSLAADKLQITKTLITRFDHFVQKALKENPEALDVQLLYHSDRWGLTGDYRFKKGRIPEGTPLNQTIQEIYEKSVPTEKSNKCVSELININKGSDIPRVCTTSCKDITHDTINLEEGLPIDERAGYVTFEALLNCSNETPKQRLEIVTPFCKQIKRQVNAMHENRYDPEFAAVRYFFLNKVLLCGTYGFPEFYSDELISEIRGSINPDGSVGNSDNTAEEKNVLTAQVAGILASVMRMIEEDNLNCDDHTPSARKV